MHVGHRKWQKNIRTDCSGCLSIPRGLILVPYPPKMHFLSTRLRLTTPNHFFLSVSSINSNPPHLSCITARHKREAVIRGGRVWQSWGTTRREVPLTLSTVIHHSTESSCWRAVSSLNNVCLNITTDARGEAYGCTL